VTLLDPSYALVISLWLAATHVFSAFDAFPYLVVTSTTKRSGKTRLLEVMSFVASNSRLLANISPAALYRTVHAEKPTLLIDESEMFSSAKGESRGLLNTGYRRGQTVKRHDGDFETYCPKAFALIGDVHDTLRDRSVVIQMRRGEPTRRFVYAAAEEEGASLREKLSAAISSKAQEIAEAVGSFEGLPFLFDRDEEIWTPLFILCRLFCPERLDELKRAAADISAAKTARPRKYLELGEEEDEAQEREYAIRLLRDMVDITVDREQITTQEAIAKLREIPTSPWRRFRGDGLKDGIEGGMVIARLLSPFGVKPKTLKIAAEGSTAKGYKRRALLEALNEIEQANHARVLEPVLATRVTGDNDTPEKLIESAERPVERPFADPAPQPSKPSANGLDYRSMLVDLLDQVEKLGPRLPVELHVKSKQHRSTLGLPPNIVSDPNRNSNVKQEEDLPRGDEEPKKKEEQPKKSTPTRVKKLSQRKTSASITEALHDVRKKDDGSVKAWADILAAFEAAVVAHPEWHAVPVRLERKMLEGILVGRKENEQASIDAKIKPIVAPAPTEETSWDGVEQTAPITYECSLCHGTFEVTADKVAPHCRTDKGYYYNELGTYTMHGTWHPPVNRPAIKGWYKMKAGQKLFAARAAGCPYCLKYTSSRSCPAHGWTEKRNFASRLEGEARIAYEAANKKPPVVTNQLTQGAKAKTHQISYTGFSGTVYTYCGKAIGGTLPKDVPLSDEPTCKNCQAAKQKKEQTAPKSTPNKEQNGAEEQKPKSDVTVRRGTVCEEDEKVSEARAAD